jgi:hypothetical protein
MIMSATAPPSPVPSVVIMVFWLFPRPLPHDHHDG